MLPVTLGMLEVLRTLVVDDNYLFVLSGVLQSNPQHGRASLTEEKYERKNKLQFALVNKLSSRTVESRYPHEHRLQTFSVNPLYQATNSYRR